MSRVFHHSCQFYLWTHFLFVSFLLLIRFTFSAHVQKLEFPTEWWIDWKWSMEWLFLFFFLVCCDSPHSISSSYKKFLKRFMRNLHDVACSALATYFVLIFEAQVNSIHSFLYFMHFAFITIVAAAAAAWFRTCFSFCAMVKSFIIKLRSWISHSLFFRMRPSNYAYNKYIARNSSLSTIIRAHSKSWKIYVRLYTMNGVSFAWMWFSFN